MAPAQTNRKVNYRSQNRAYIETLEKLYLAAHPTKKSLMKKLMEYLETHPFIAKPNQVLFAVEERGVEGIQTGLLLVGEYNDKFNTGPDLGRFNAYGYIFHVGYLKMLSSTEAKQRTTRKGNDKSGKQSGQNGGPANNGAPGPGQQTPQGQRLPVPNGRFSPVPAIRRDIPRVGMMKGAGSSGGSVEAPICSLGHPVPEPGQSSVIMENPAKFVTKTGGVFMLYATVRLRQTEQRFPIDVGLDTGSQLQTFTYNQYQRMVGKQLENGRKYWTAADIVKVPGQVATETIHLGDGSLKEVPRISPWVQYFRDEARTQPLTSEFRCHSGILIEDQPSDKCPNLTGNEFLMQQGLAFVITPGLRALYVGNAQDHTVRCHDDHVFEWDKSRKVTDGVGSWGVAFTKKMPEPPSTK